MDLDDSDQSLSTFVRAGSSFETIGKLVEGKKEVLALEKDILLTKIAEDRRKDARKDKVRQSGVDPTKLCFSSFYNFRC